jgi:MFS transporter, AAHS family, 4-hydroxybenzoate transporter
MDPMQTTRRASHSASAPRIRVAALCAAVLLIEGYDIAVVGYVVPSLVDGWRVPAGVLTYALTAGNLGMLLGSLIAGLLGDRYGRKPVLIGSVTVFGIFSFFSAFVTSPAQLAAARALTGLGLGGGVPLAITLAADFAPSITKGRFVILSSLGVPVGFALAGFLSGWLISAFGWPAAFIAGGLAPLFLALLLFRELPESLLFAVETPARAGGVAALFRGGRAMTTLLLWTINLLNLLATYFLLLWTPAILHRAGASPSTAIIATTMFSVGVIVSPALTALIIDRLAVERVVAVVLVFGGFCVLTVGLFDPPFNLFLGLMFGVGIGAGSQGGINALSALMYPPRIRATGAGWALGFGRIGGIIGPLVGGAMLGDSFTAQQIYAAAAVPAFSAAALTATLGRARCRNAMEEIDGKEM